MPITTSSGLGITVPGAGDTDSRLLDIQAVRSALLSIDNILGTYINDNPTPVPVLSAHLTNYGVFYTNSNEYVDVALDMLNILSGTEFTWELSGLSVYNEINLFAPTGEYDINSGTVNADSPNFGFTLTNRTPLASVEYFTVTLTQTTEGRMMEPTKVVLAINYML